VFEDVLIHFKVMPHYLWCEDAFRDLGSVCGCSPYVICSKCLIQKSHFMHTILESKWGTNQFTEGKLCCNVEYL
jgi:hypothetical protein